MKTFLFHFSVGALVLVILVSTLTVANSVYEYKLSVIDRDAPTIDLLIPHIPAPDPRRSLPRMGERKQNRKEVVPMCPDQTCGGRLSWVI